MRWLVVLAPLLLASQTTAIPFPPTGHATSRSLKYWPANGCTGEFSERCMGTLKFCETRDKNKCLAMREQPDWNEL
ncbi:hypothetical protein GQ602_005999 [Ophiocordyceps camponoti-floridani]|uniref:Antifungal protein n=1 Tax=Ophiocordyceps camponoti-floridani TaxID=2030778 RepID=A0A8H4Q2B3_9HYPO|nr:hypothetical protein GQ602_005999 [Ophiocordyceps camponoti-floridani]